MSTEIRALTLSEIRATVLSAKGRLQVALHGLDTAGHAPERDMVTGYAGATSIKHLREAVREIDKALVQLDTVTK